MSIRPNFIKKNNSKIVHDDQINETDKKFFEEHWTEYNDKQLIEFDYYCGENSYPYYYRVFAQEFIHLQESFFINHYTNSKSKRIRDYFRSHQKEIFNPKFSKYPRSWKTVFTELPPKQEEIQQKYRDTLIKFLSDRLWRLFLQGKIKFINRKRYCKVSEKEFNDNVFSKHISYNQDGIKEWELLNYHIDISPEQFDCFKKYTNEPEVKKSIPQLRELLDFLGFIPQKDESVFQILTKVPREKFYDFIRISKDVFYPAIYDTVYGDWLKAVIETGFLGEEGILKGKFGYKVVAKDGHICNSISERVIDDWLYENNIKHKKEPPYPKAVRKHLNSNVRADWRVNDIYIEFFGLQSEENYAEKTFKKIASCKKYKVRLIGLFPGDEYKLSTKLLQFIKD